MSHLFMFHFIQGSVTKNEIDFKVEFQNIHFRIVSLLGLNYETNRRHVLWFLPNVKDCSHLFLDVSSSNQLNERSKIVRFRVQWKCTVKVNIVFDQRNSTISSKSRLQASTLHARVSEKISELLTGGISFDKVRVLTKVRKRDIRNSCQAGS